MGWAATLVFVAMFVLISTEKLSNAVAAVSGAALCIVCGIVKQASVYTAINWNVLLLLINMMIIVNVTKTTGIFQFLAIKTAKAAKGSPIAILILLSVLTAVISAFLDNVTTILIIAPVAITIAAELAITPLPFLISLAIASNIGGTATLIGDPPNIMIASAGNLSFGSFITQVAPLVIVIMAVFCLLATALFRKQIAVSEEKKARIMKLNEKEFLKDPPLLFASVGILLLTVVGFFFNDVLGVDESTIAMCGAALMMLCYGKRGIGEIFKEVEWTTIIFFCGLFILVGALVDQGIIALCSNELISVTHGNFRAATVLILWVSGIFSAFLDNIPYTATMIPLIEGFGKGADAATMQPLWWALSLGACLGGNGTLIGASANVIVSSLAQKSGWPLRFIEFTKYGLLVTAINLLLSTAYLLLKYFA
jgi:Na+/H+ antiporter NhaD/arsenite permease-like protein